MTPLGLESLTGGRGHQGTVHLSSRQPCVLCSSWPGSWRSFSSWVGAREVLRGGGSSREEGSCQRVGSPGCQRRLPGEGWTKEQYCCLDGGSEAAGWQGGWGFCSGLWLEGLSEAVRPEGGLGNGRAFVRLAPFPTAAATFFGPFAQLSLSPGLWPTCLSPGQAWASHWALGPDLAEETWVRRNPSRGPPLPSLIHYRTPISLL